ncbi:MAG: hypothetical protein L0Z62_17615 [Gemmataceae bacterium]|nr:hypothetical protein [Gemmataceae bacterium]
MFGALPRGLPKEAYELGPLIARFKSPKLLAVVGIAVAVLLGVGAFAAAVAYAGSEDVWLIATFGGYGGVIGLVVVGILVGLVIPWLIFMNVWMWGERRVFVCEGGLIQTKGPLYKPVHFYGERSAQVCRWDQVDTVKHSTAWVRPGLIRGWWQESIVGRRRRRSAAGVTDVAEPEIGRISLQRGDEVLMTLSRQDLAGFDRLVDLIRAKAPAPT